MGSAGLIDVNYAGLIATANNTQTSAKANANATRTLADELTTDHATELNVVARNKYATDAGQAKLDRALEQSANSKTSATNLNNDTRDRDNATSDRENSQSKSLQEAEKTYQIALLDAMLVLLNAEADAGRDYAIATGTAWESYIDDAISYENYMQILSDAAEDYNTAMESAYDTYNAAAKAAWNTLRSAYIDALRADSKADAEDAREKVNDVQDEAERFVGDDADSLKAEAGSLKDAAIALALATSNIEKARAASFAESERAYLVTTATATKTLADSSITAIAGRKIAEFIRDAAQREDRVAARGIYEVTVYDAIAIHVTNQAFNAGSSISIYHAQMAQADSARAHALRIAKDTFQDSISMAGLNELQAQNTADAIKNSVVGAAELAFSIAVAMASKMETIGRANAYYDLYYAHAVAMAELTEILAVNMADGRVAETGASADKERSLADAAKGKADSVADAMHALQTALNEDWQPIEWYGGGFGGWYGGWGWGGWYGGFGGWYGGWGGWSGYGGYVFGYSAYGWSYGGYGGFGGWGGNGWGMGGWYGGWGYGFGWGYGMGGTIGGDHTGDQEDYNDAVDAAQTVFDTATDAANDSFNAAKRAAALQKATKNGDATVDYATARGEAGVDYVTAVNLITNNYGLSYASGQLSINGIIATADEAHTLSFATADENASVARVNAEVALRYAEMPIFIEYAEDAASAETVFQITEATARATRLQPYASTSPRAQYDAAYASATVYWLQNTAEYYIQRAGLREQYARQMSDSLATHESTMQLSQSQADHAYSIIEVGAQHSLANDSNTSQSELAAAQRIQWTARRTERSTASAAYELALANAARDYEMALSQVEGEPTSEAYINASKVLNVVRVTAEQDAGRIWSAVEHTARRVYTQTLAISSRDRDLVVVASERNFKLSLADALKTKYDAYSQAEYVFANAEVSERNLKQSHDAGVDALYWGMEETWRLYANSIINNVLQTPWSQYLVNASQANKSWLSAITSVYWSLITNRNNLESAYVDAVATAKRNLGYSTSNNVRSYSNQYAQLSYDAAAFQATTEFNYTNSSATTAFAFVEQLATIERNRVIAEANESGTGGGGNSVDFAGLIAAAKAGFTATDTATQTTYRQSIAQSRYNLQLELIARDVILATSKSTLGTDYRAQESYLHSTNVHQLAILDSTFAMFEKNSVASSMNYSAILTPSPWMTYAAAQATAMVTWFAAMAPSRATLDQSKAIAQRGLEQAYFNAKETWTSTELVNFRGEDKAKALQRYVIDSQIVPRELPTPSLAPSLDGIYRRIAAGTIPDSIAGSKVSGLSTFSTTGSTMTGTSILNPNGVFTDPMGYGAGYGFGYGYGGSGTFTVGNYNPTVHWDLIGEADAIQSTDPTDDLVDLYWIEAGNLVSILDSELPDEQLSNSGGGSSGGSGSGEGPNTSRSPSQQASQKRQFDFEIFKIFLKRIDPIALQTFEFGNGKLKFGSAMLWGEISVSHRGQPIHGDLTFWVDEKWSELDAAARVAQYIAEERTEVRSRYQYIAMTTPGMEVDAAHQFAKRWYKDAGELSANGVAVYLGFLSILNEGTDLIVTVDELSKGNWMATIGLLPFVPATGFVRIVDKAGNSKLLDNVAMTKLQALGAKADINAAKQILNQIPDDIWCFATDTLVSTPTGKRRIDELDVGAFVCSYDHDTSAWIAAKIAKVHRNNYSGVWCSIRTSNGVIESTANHPFWVANGHQLDKRSVPEHYGIHGDEGKQLSGRWVNSHELLPGDRLVSHDGKEVNIASIELTQVENRPIRNLTVEGVHSFAVGDGAVLAHNASSWCDAMAAHGLAKPQSLVDLVGKVKTVWGYTVTPSMIHGHHIVMKTVPWKWDARRPFIQKSQDILKKYDIKLLGTVDELKKAGSDELQNMCYAINGYKGIHSLKYTQAVAKKLEAAVKQGKGDFDKTRTLIKIELSLMKTSLEKGKSFWD